MQGKGAVFIGGNQGRPLSKGELKENLKKVWEQDIYIYIWHGICNSL